MSYLAAAVRKRAPLVRWEMARDRHKRYHFNNHPVLVSGTGEVHNFLPDRLWISAGASLRGVRESPEDAMAVYARRLIEQLNEGDGRAAEPMVPGPAFEIEDVRDEPGGYDFEVGLGDEIAHERSVEVDRLIRELSREDGIHEVFREDRELVRARGGRQRWDAAGLVFSAGWWLCTLLWLPSGKGQRRWHASAWPLWC